MPVIDRQELVGTGVGLTERGVPGGHQPVEVSRRKVDGRSPVGLTGKRPYRKRQVAVLPIPFSDMRPRPSPRWRPG